MTAPAMGPRTREALEASIRHWKENAAAENPNDANVFGEACPLCHIFYKGRGDCEGCPVANATGFGLCERTPWGDASKAWGAWAHDHENDGPDFAALRAEFRRAALAEVEFLESRLPKDPAS